MSFHPSIVRATALEVLSEPLTLLVMLAALALSVLAPAFHCHQFGEATRMARDAGFSAALLGGGVLSVFGTVRAMRREIESGTLEMALSRPVSYATFFVSKAAGAWLAAVAVVAIVFFTSLAVVEGAAVGGRIAERTGDVARIWGPAVVVSASVVVVPPAAAAALNRFARSRFVLTAVLVAAASSVSAGAWAVLRDAPVLVPYFAAIAPLAFLLAVWTSAAAAFASCLRANAASALSGLVVVVGFPFFGNYYLANELSNGGGVAWTYVGAAVLASSPAVAAFLLFGCRVGERLRQFWG